jgi:hypothetical protein
MQKPSDGTQIKQPLNLRDRIKTIFVQIPVTRLKRVNVVNEDSWREYIVTGRAI